MKSLGVIGILLFSLSVLPQNGRNSKPVIQYTTGKSVDVTVNLVYTSKGQPEYYSARLQSPVCMEDLCNPIDVIMEWDLLGDFRAYKEHPDKPITKFDHVPLTPKDHIKLRKILGNKESLLQDYKIEALVDTTKLVYSEEIDGMTGATSKTFENDIVPGAVYTCYTLWHFVNGELQKQLKEYSKSVMDEELMVHMIQSGKENYLNYILERDSLTCTSAMSSELGVFVWEGDPILSVKVINTLNEDFWKSNKTMETLRNRFLNLSIPVQNALIRHFSDGSVSKDYLSIFMHLLPKVKETQQIQIYRMLEANGKKLDIEMKEALRNIFKSPHYPISAKEYELLNTLGIDL